MFSKACEYGIRAVLFIFGSSKEGRKVGLKEICEEIEAPAHFTAKILQNLVKHGLIESAKGPNGGFFINEDRRGLRLREVVEVIDGDSIFTGCGLGLKQCNPLQPCPIHHDFEEIRNGLSRLLSETGFEKLADEVSSGKAFLKRAFA